MKVYIYRNLHRSGHVYSLRAMEGEHSGRVVGYASSLFVEDAEFRVNEAGRQRVLSTKQKNVHAGIIGNVTAAHDLEVRLPNPMMYEETYYNIGPRKNSIVVKYNPYAHGFFYNEETREPIRSSKLLIITRSQIEAIQFTA